MFASSDNLLTVDQAVSIVRDYILYETMRAEGMNGSDLERRLRKSFQEAAAGRIGIDGSRPILSITAEDVRANAGRHLTDQQVLAILNAEWGHAASSTLPDAMGELIFNKAIALGYAADRGG